jgi:eukaryotic-like serine/threonine-protein kinase
MATLAPGDRLGPYEIVDTLGAGGMGVVYRAHDTHLQRTVAVKVLDEDDVAGGATADSLLHEARAASALNHPGICTVFEVREEAGLTFIVMEYVEGRPLSQQIPADGLPGDSVLRYGVQVADALAHAHDRGILHRDLKSSNVILTREGRAKIVDFGLARRFAQISMDAATRSNSRVDEAERFTGTLAYMAPEVLQGDPPSVTSDIWALGVLLYEMASGRLPFTGRSAFDLTGAILRGPLPPLPMHVPASVRTIIGHCLVKEPHQRYRTAREVHAALEAVQSDASIAPPPPEPAARNRERRWWRDPRVVAAAAIAAAIAIWSLGRSRPSITSSETGRLVQVLSSDRQAAEPALSGDGTMIAYVAEDERGQFDLYVSRVAGGGRVRVTNDAARESRPRFSPDGERIVFARRRAGSPASEICAVPALGGETTVITSGSQPVWAPEGQRIAFVRLATDGRQWIATANADGHDVRDLVAGDGAYPFVRAPAWSPDARSIVFVRGTGGVAGELWVVPSAGGAPRKLSSEPPSIASDDPMFSFDGASVVHASNRGGATNIWALPIRGGAPVRLTTGPGPDESPTVDREGHVAFMNARWTNHLAVRDLTTSSTRTFVRHTPFLWAPAFSPDGGTIAYSRGEVDGAWHIWLIGSNGESPRRLTSSDLGEVYSRWTPDGASIVYHTWAKPRRIWRVPRDGGPPAALTPPQIDASFGDMSPDGRTLVFVATDAGGEHVNLTPLGGAGPGRVLTAGSVPRWSPDGAWIAYAPDHGYYGGIFVIRPDGSGARRLTSRGGWPVWWPDGSRVAYITIRSDGTQQIDTVALDGTPGRALAIAFEGTNHPFDVSRDGRSIALTNAAHVSSEIWVLASQR